MLFGRRRPTVGRKASGGRIHSAPRPTAGRRLSRRLKSAFLGASRQASASADAKDAFGRRRPTVGRKASGGRIHSARRPTVGRRLSRRLKSAFQGASRQASASADAKDAFGRRRPTVGRKASRGRIHSAPRPTIGRRLSRRLKSAFQGASRQASASADTKSAFPVGAGRPSAVRPPEAEFIRRPGPTAGRRLSRRLKSAFQGASRQASASADAKDTLPVGAGRPSAARPLEAEFIRRPGPTVGRRLSRRLKSAFQGASRQASASADAKDAFGRRRPTVGRKASGGRIHSAPRANRRPQASRSNSFATIPVIPVGGGRPPRAPGAPACGRPPPGDGPHNRGTAPA
jgi:hypothetical protein